jgi:hypothetical protein
MRKPNPLLLMIGINASHAILSLSVVTITTRRIVRDVLEVNKFSSRNTKTFYASGLISTLPISTTGFIGYP